jgi:hypothetical protein
MMRRRFIQISLLAAILAAAPLPFGASAGNSNTMAVAGISETNLTADWTQVPFTFQIQRPYDLQIKDRYKFDPLTGTHDFWVFYTDKPHAPPPNKTNARTEMRLQTYHSDEHMFDADVNVGPGTFACIMQVFDAAHGPVTMLIAHPDGTVTVGRRMVRRDAIGHWWNLKVTNDPSPGGQIRIYADNILVATLPSRGPRDYYFKCGVYSRNGSDRSEAHFRHIKMRIKRRETSSTSPGEK